MTSSLDSWRASQQRSNWKRVHHCGTAMCLLKWRHRFWWFMTSPLYNWRHVKHHNFQHHVDITENVVLLNLWLTQHYLLARANGLVYQYCAAQFTTRSSLWHHWIHDRYFDIRQIYKYGVTEFLTSLNGSMTGCSLNMIHIVTWKSWQANHKAWDHYR